MKRSILTGWSRTLALAALLTLALSGCGETPVNAPMTSGNSPGSNAPSSGAPRLVVEPTGGTATFEAAPQMNADGTPVLDESSALRALTSSAEIDGAVGGALRCGRFVVQVPPGAFEGKGTVTMNVPDSEIAFVDLSISPSTLNQFKTGVALSYDPTGLGLTDPLTIYWYDTATQDWVDLHAKTNLTTGYPTVLLGHFSPYGGGKAGW